MKFEDAKLAEQIKANLIEAGFKRPTDIQYKAIPPIMKGEDVLAIAQTGTGKTAAFVIPVLDLLFRKVPRNRREGSTRCLVMCPTHELAIQIRQVFDQIGKGMGLRSLAIFGGTEQEMQIGTLKRGVDVLVATPGRLFDLRHQGALYLGDVEILVLDEADHMLDLGFIDDIRDLIRYIPRTRQTLFFSATISEEIKKLAYSLVHSTAIRIQISPKDPVSKNVSHAVAFVEMDDKRFFLERMVRDHPESKILVFVRTKVRSERVVAALKRVEIDSEAIHSGKDQKTRSEILDAFRKGTNKILVATDVSARGIDIPNVDYVINYDLPEVAENYVHRVGRTGRGVAKGIAISFCSSDEKAVLKEIEAYLDKPVEVLDLDRETYEDTIAESKENPHDWRALMTEIEAVEAKKKEKKRKK
ncbi:MAG: DEAD/DEAH box helicase [Bacteroidetes bacterium]|nr:DEAD/DEAH box helicase [Bacteroidota bacterium]